MSKGGFRPVHGRHNGGLFLDPRPFSDRRAGFDFCGQAAQLFRKSLNLRDDWSRKGGFEPPNPVKTNDGLGLSPESCGTAKSPLSRAGRSGRPYLQLRPHVQCRAREYNRADLSNSLTAQKERPREAGCDYRVAVRLDFSRLVLSRSFICWKK
jgi:hypothetical protein